MKLKHIWWECPICHKKIYTAEFIITQTKINPCDNYVKHQQIKDKEQHEAIPKEKVNLFLKFFHEGKTVGESAKQAGLNDDERFLALKFNIAQYSYIRQEAL